MLDEDCNVFVARPLILTWDHREFRMACSIQFLSYFAVVSVLPVKKLPVVSLCMLLAKFYIITNETISENNESTFIFWQDMNKNFPFVWVLHFVYNVMRMRQTCLLSFSLAVRSNSNCMITILISISSFHTTWENDNHKTRIVEFLDRLVWRYKMSKMYIPLYNWIDVYVAIDQIILCTYKGDWIWCCRSTTKDS